MYAPGLGAFSSLDSVMGSAQNPLSMNRFLYAHANPATLIDPTGHASISQGQLCSPYADYCGNMSNPSSPNGPTANTSPVATKSSQAPSCSPNCTSSGGSTPVKRPTEVPTKPVVQSTPAAIPTWLWAEYGDYLRSNQYLYIDRQTPVEIYANGGDSAFAFLGWYGGVFSAIAFPVGTSVGFAVSDACGGDLACQVAATIIGAKAWSMAAAKGGTAIARVSSAVVGRRRDRHPGHPPRPGGGHGTPAFRCL